MASNLQAVVHLKGALERLNLIETHFILHLQLISYIYASVIASKCFQTTHWGLPVGFLLLRYSVLFTVESLRVSLLYLLFIS